VTRQRLRPAYTADELAAVYPKPHDHLGWHDHVVRIEVTSALTRSFLPRPRTAADLSCGDGALLASLGAARGVFGDFAHGWPVTGPLEETLADLDPVDVYVCTETLEHLDDPDLVLRMIRAKTQALVLSTPVDAWDEKNPEHYWAWSRTDVEEMLTAAEFTPMVYSALDFRPRGSEYCFGIWVCS
jgi:hypothetical protein